MKLIENPVWIIDGMTDEEIKNRIPVRTFKCADEIIILLRNKDFCNVQLFGELQKLEGINQGEASAINFAASEYRREK